MNWFCCNGEPLGIHVVGSIAGCTALVGIETKPTQRNQDEGKRRIRAFPLTLSSFGRLTCFVVCSNAGRGLVL